VTTKEIIRELKRQYVPIGGPPPIAILDTNVYIDIHSAHRLFGAFACALEKGDTAIAAVDDSEMVFRRVRARESLLLALYLNKIGAVTWSLGPEALSKLIECVPHEVETEVQLMALWHTYLAIRFVKPLLLPNWLLSGVDPDAGWQTHLSKLYVDSSKWPEPTGSAADAFLISCAKRTGLPLISSEGLRVSGYGVSDIAKRGKREGVQVLFPKQFYAGKVDEAAEIDAFLRRFDEHAPKYLDQDPSARDQLDEMRGTLHHVLLGHTAGRTAPARVRI
jgi:hypothetical protein